MRQYGRKMKGRTTLTVTKARRARRQFNHVCVMQRPGPSSMSEVILLTGRGLHNKGWGLRHKALIILARFGFQLDVPGPRCRLQDTSFTSQKCLASRREQGPHLNALVPVWLPCTMVRPGRNGRSRPPSQPRKLHPMRRDY